MSRLYGSLDADASKTTATRRAHRNITGHVRGWNSGVEIRAYVDEQDRDVFEVYRTGGSNGGLAPRMVARIMGDHVETLVHTRGVGTRVWNNVTQGEHSHPERYPGEHDDCEVDVPHTHPGTDEDMRQAHSDGRHVWRRYAGCPDCEQVTA